MRTFARVLVFLPFVITRPWHVIGHAGHIRLPMLVVALISLALYAAIAWYNLRCRARRVSLLLSSLGIALLPGPGAVRRGLRQLRRHRTAPGCYNPLMGAKTRRAVPGDAPALAEICYMAGRSHSRRSLYDLLFPGPYGDTLERLRGLERMLTTGHACWLHHSRFIVAEAEGAVAAGLSGFPAEEAGNRDFALAFMELGWTGPDLQAMVERMTPFLKVDPPWPEGAWVVENVACFPDFRGRGLVNGLLEEVLEEGRRCGHVLAQINIMTGNTPAQRAYEKVGFRVEREYTDPSFEEFFGSPGMTSLLLPL